MKVRFKQPEPTQEPKKIRVRFKKPETVSYADADKWITVHPNGKGGVGSPVLIGEDGTVKGGMGGKFNGKNIKDAHGTERFTSGETNQETKERHERERRAESKPAEAQKAEQPQKKIIVRPSKAKTVEQRVNERMAKQSSNQYQSFDEWHKEADIPMKDKDGDWYDAETGIYWDKPKGIQVTQKTREQMTKEEQLKDRAKQSRQNASNNKLKALTGTVKQKAWAESIRSTAISSLKQRGDKYVQALASPIFSKSSLWIDKRNNINELVSDVVSIIDKRDKLNELHAKGESSGSEYKKIEAEFRGLIKKYE